MASSNAVGGTDPDKSSESKDNKPHLFTPAKDLHDYFLTKDVSNESETPEILAALFNTVTHERIDTDEYKRLIDKILIFNPTTNDSIDKKIQKISDRIEIVKDKDRLKLLSKKRVDALPRVENAFKDVAEKYRKLKSDIEEFKYMKLPEIVTELRSFEDEGLLPSMSLLYKSVKIIEQCINLSNIRIVSFKKIEEFRYSVNCLIELTNTPENLAKMESKSVKPESEHIEIISIQIVNLEKECVESKKSACRSELNTQKSICRSEHNTPFCKNCGWRTSWLKNFKKRGVYIKEADNSASQHIWHNNVDTD